MRRRTSGMLPFAFSSINFSPAAVISLTGGAFYPLRVVRSLRLLPGDKVEIATFQLFGVTAKPRVQVLPLQKISALNSRSGTQSGVHFNVKGQRFPYILDKTKGSFPNPHHFDFLFAIKRS